MEENSQHMKNLRTHMNDVEDQAAKITVEEQMQPSNVQNLEKDLLFVRNETKRVKEEADRMMESKGLICTRILEKLASLELESYNLSQTLDLMQQERASMSAKLNEKRECYSKVGDDIATELKDQQDWIHGHKHSIIDTVNDLMENKSCHITCEDEEVQLIVTNGTKLKLEDAKAKYNQMTQMKHNLVLENCKIQQCTELNKGNIQSFASIQPDLTNLDLNQLDEELQALLGDEDGEAEYLQSLQLQIVTSMRDVVRPRLHHAPLPPPAAVTSISDEEEDREIHLQGSSMEDLHESTLSHIISFLPTDSAIQTSAVAQIWRNLWRFTSVLDFDMFYFHGRNPRESIRRARNRFATFTSSVIGQRPVNLPLQKFKLYICYKHSPQLRLMVNHWLSFAVESGVRELDCDFELENQYVQLFGINLPWDDDDELDNEEDDSNDSDGDDSDDTDGDDSDDTDEEQRKYSFDFSILENHAVKVLRLRGCTFSIPKAGVQFETIKGLYMESFPCSERKIMRVISSCPNLEVLSLVGGNNMVNLKIVSPKLKRVRLEDYRLYDMGDGSVDIFAPCLEVLQLSSVLIDKLVLRNTATLYAATVGYAYMCYTEFVFWTYLIYALSGVERLTTQNMWHWAVQVLEDEDAPKNLLGDKRWPKRGTYVSQEASRKDGLYSYKIQPEKRMFSETFAFQNLKHVELLTGYRRDDIIGLEILLSTCPILETMTLIYAYTSKLDNDLRGTTIGPIRLMMPCLKLVKMKEFQNTKSEMFVVDLLKKHGVVLEEIVAYPKKVNELSMPPVVL